VQVFVLATMAFTVLFALVSGDARLMLVRNGWGTAALGLWALLTLIGNRPFLLSTGTIAFPQDKAAIWEQNWKQHPAFRTLLRRCTAIWGTLFLLDAALRVGMALTLPIDLVPALDDVLLAVTIAAILLIQRFYGRSFLHRHDLRLDGAEIVPATHSTAERGNGNHNPTNTAFPPPTQLGPAPPLPGHRDGRTH
jgi:hypothetical protein